jgi:hypothetical protein
MFFTFYVSELVLSFPPYVLFGFAIIIILFLLLILLLEWDVVENSYLWGLLGWKHAYSKINFRIQKGGGTIWVWVLWSCFVRFLSHTWISSHHVLFLYNSWDIAGIVTLYNTPFFSSNFVFKVTTQVWLCRLVSSADDTVQRYPRISKQPTDEGRFKIWWLFD